MASEHHGAMATAKYNVCLSVRIVDCLNIRQFNPADKQRYGASF